MSELVDLEPATAHEYYIDDRKEEWSYDTKLTIERALDLFLEWCEEENITNMNDLGGRDLFKFKRWRKSHDIKKISLNGTLANLRPFLIFVEDIEGAPKDLHEKIPFPQVSEEDEVRDDSPPAEQVTAIRDWLNTYHYASRPHVEFELILNNGLRSGAVRGIDEEDYDPDERMIELHHRPGNGEKRGTPLKNGTDSQRHVNITVELNQLLLDYRNSPERKSTTDKFGRKPLFTSIDSDGSVRRIGLSRIRDDFYKVSRHCEFAGTCPEDREFSSCEAHKNRHAYACPVNFSPHALRMFSIEEQLDNLPMSTVSDRVDVSVPTLKKHYDRRSKERKRKQRLKVLEENLPGYVDDENDNPNAVVDPVTGGLLITGSIAMSTIQRLDHELRSLATHDGELQSPTLTKIKKGTVAYAAFVGLITINLQLIGLV